MHLFEDCPHLEVLHVSGINQLGWELCKESSQRWEDPKLTKFTVRLAKLDSEFGEILARLPALTELEIDGPAVNIKAAALSW